MSQAPPLPITEVHSKFVPPPFVCACTPDARASVRIRVEGELDLATVPKFRRVLRGAQSGARVVSLDLRKLAFIDCCALGEILEADAFARRTGGKLLLMPGSGQVDRVMALTGILERMEVAGPRPAGRT